MARLKFPHYVIAKVSRPEVAEAFMSPAPADIVKKLVARGKLTAEEARLGVDIPISHDICLESDWGWPILISEWLSLWFHPY